jgi:hypothetical protein
MVWYSTPDQILVQNRGFKSTNKTQRNPKERNIERKKTIFLAQMEPYVLYAKDMTSWLEYHR